MRLLSIVVGIVVIATFLLGAWIAALAQSGTGVFTHHHDYWRSGWNSVETVLTPDSISSTGNKFGVIATVNNLDDTVFAQPLIVSNLQIVCPANQTTITCQKGLLGQYEVAFVVVANTVYAIDAVNGQILLKRNFGRSGSCGGIKSTPVIDPATHTMYVMTHTVENGSQPFILHALNVTNLTDAISPFTITPFNTFKTLTNGTVYRFISEATCLRSALLLVGDNIYAGFRGNEFMGGSPPTIQSGPTRGWLLGWNASNLAPLSPLLTDGVATAANSFFLSSIWMSGSGIASDGTNLYFTTGNSDPSGTSYDPVNNIEESVVQVTPNLTVSSIFTPSNFAQLDAEDNEIGSGGVAVIPTSPPLVVTGGKDGRMFLLNGNDLGGYTPGGPDHVLDMKNIGGCWCAPSFFIDPDGVARVVSSGGSSVITWKVMQTASSTTPQLVQDGIGQIADNSQDPGFFTSVSSNGTGQNFAGIIWAVGRPAAGSTGVTLYAFDATPVNGTLRLLGQYPAGTWTAPSNANIVPVVANGKVYVASGAGIGAGTLTIFGLKP